MCIKLISSDSFLTYIFLFCFMAKTYKNKIFLFIALTILTQITKYKEIAIKNKMLKPGFLINIKCNGFNFIGKIHFNNQIRIFFNIVRDGR